ncbi:hypothetical protein ACO0K9_19765 [Undibacterium sp. Ji50W]|uniref:hypothetical protein n=1 Tax=Undibacterium sp. Ji50W TaxID=3413041 RepID=UPI003BF0A2DF
MYRILTAMPLIFVSVNLMASTEDIGFKCEMIKDKPVRNLCIKDRTSKEQSNAEAATLKIAADEEKEKATAEQKRLAEFVKKAEDILTKDFKDPLGAQFTDLKIVESPFQVLCGQVNGKNSYGAYVGSKSFYVQFMGSTVDSRIVELPKKAADKGVYEAEMNLLNAICKGGKAYP